MLTDKRKRATLVPQSWMKCPCCYNPRGFEISYQLHETRDPSILRVRQDCRCHISEQIAEHLATMELAGRRA